MSPEPNSVQWAILGKAVGCKYPVKDSVRKSLGDVRALCILAMRLVETQRVRAVVSWTSGQFSTWCREIPLDAVVRCRPCMVHWDPNTKGRQYEKDETTLLRWHELPNSFEEYGRLLKVKPEDFNASSDRCPYTNAHERLGASLKLEQKARSLKSLRLQPAEGSYQWYCVVELDLTPWFRDKLGLGDDDIVVICQDQLVATKEPDLKASKYHGASGEVMFEAWAMKSSVMKCAARDESEEFESIREAEVSIGYTLGAGKRLLSHLNALDDSAA
jgi:hypothetical protein